MTTDSNTQSMECASAYRPNLGILLVAAIDFGTTYSGLGWQYSADFKRNKLQIQAKKWQGSARGGFISEKTPTALLLDPGRKFVAFGCEAEDSYAELADDNAHHGYYFFKNFKMLLYKEKVKNKI